MHKGHTKPPCTLFLQYWRVGIADPSGTASAYVVFMTPLHGSDCSPSKVYLYASPRLRLVVVVFTLSISFFPFFSTGEFSISQSAPSTSFLTEDNDVVCKDHRALDSKFHMTGVTVHVVKDFKIPLKGDMVKEGTKEGEK